ncbi:MAG: hypothetical protein D4R65_02420 [Verrucomicrobiaceae bacterium]|nr:MAG: hypothetical protein D4R65_02420 [Verrucomicrobiaceae bacterium]
MVLGGLAVISHGLSRVTHDADCWLDPTISIEDWCNAVKDLLVKWARLRLVSIGNWSEMPPADLAGYIEDFGVVRVLGATQPFDIFRRPNEMEVSGFEEVWERATPLTDGTRLPDVVDLLITKQDTGRPRDTYDIQFLEGKAEEMYLERLPKASSGEALKMLERFLNPKVAAAAAAHSDPKVRETGMKFLRELADAGDPFARDLLAAVGGA